MFLLYVIPLVVLFSTVQHLSQQSKVIPDVRQLTQPRQGAWIACSEVHTTRIEHSTRRVNPHNIRFQSERPYELHTVQRPFR